MSRVFPNILNNNMTARNATVSAYEKVAGESYNWGVLLLLPLVLFGMAGNCLVCMAVSMEKRLQTFTNYFLLSLAITDLLVCIIVMPFSIINEFMGYWPFDSTLCDLYVTSDVLMCTSSILHLCAISFERYLAIRSPLKSRKRSKTTVIAKLILVWVVAIAISSPIMILGLVDEANVLNDNQCILSNSDFIVYGSVGAFFIPLAIMVIFLGLTIQILHRQAQLCDPTHREGEPMMRRFTCRKTSRNIIKEYAMRSVSCPAMQDSQCSSLTNSRTSTKGTLMKTSRSLPLNAYLEGRSRESSEFSKQSSFHSEDSTIIEEETGDTAPSPATEMDQSSGFTVLTSTSQSPRRQNNSVPLRLQELVKKHTSMSQFGIKRDSLKQRQVKNSVKTEQKASKVLGIVFVLFVVCWAPFFIVNIMTVLCNRCHFDHMLISVFVWLGYVSSTLNPIIYTTFNRTFRTTFIKLLKCQYRTIQKPVPFKTWCIGPSTDNMFTSVLQMPL